jgi:DnaJ like chaperone protein
LLHQLISTPAKVSRAQRRLLVGLRYHIDGLWEDVWREDRKTKRARLPKNPALRDLSFTYAVIALCARVARNSHGLTREKYVTFREAFPLQDDMCGKLRELFLLACEDENPTEDYIAHIVRLFPKRRDLHTSIASRLFAVASAQGTITKEDELLLARISHLLGISAMDYARIRAHHLEGRMAHEKLGVEKDAPLAAIKRRYRELMQRYHPDRFAKGRISQELEMLLQLRSAEINDAYRQMSKRAA